MVTGIPLEFQFGTNWARFSNYAGGVIGQTLAMEGVFAFFAESVFLGIFLVGRDAREPARCTGCRRVMVFAGSWLSGFFIIATNAWMQHPVAYRIDDGRRRSSTRSWDLLTQPVAAAGSTSHNMGGAALTGRVRAGRASGAFYPLLDRHHDVRAASACASAWSAR